MSSDCCAQATSEIDLIGMLETSIAQEHCLKHRSHEPSPALRAFCARAVAKANQDFRNRMAAAVAPTNEAAPATAAAASTKDTMADLVRAVREEDHKVHVDLHARIPLANLGSLPVRCYPAGDVTDKCLQCLTR